jgi:hypothetical protein
MRGFRTLVGALALIAALSVSAEVRVVLHAPADGAVLRGGTRATVSWSAAGLPPFVEEWEAFLSVDGGKFYAYRITPHLEIDERQFTFDVPNVETSEARILIRAGDEGREIELDSSQTFAIRQDATRSLATVPLAIVEEQRGEPARAGDRGVVEWIDGERDGSHLTPRTARQCAEEIREAPASECHADPVEGSVLRSATSSPASWAPATFAGSIQRLRAASGHRTGRDVLLSCRRLNI